MQRGNILQHRLASGHVRLVRHDDQGEPRPSQRSARLDDAGQKLQFINRPRWEWPSITDVGAVQNAVTVKKNGPTLAVLTHP